MTSISPHFPPPHFYQPNNLYPQLPMNTMNSGMMPLRAMPMPPQLATPNPLAASKLKSSNANSTTKNAGNGVQKVKTQMHRRSRTGCYTCRLRRKKCDEGAPVCSACSHLGLQCEYKRPRWWADNDSRSKQKEDIKVIIKRKKMSEKTNNQQHHHQHQHHHHHQHQPHHPHHALRTPISPPFPQTATGLMAPVTSGPLAMDGLRPVSIDTQFNSYASPSTTSGYSSQSSIHPEFPFGAGFSPYDIDIRTERQMFVNDVPTLHESSVSSLSFQDSLEWAQQFMEEKAEIYPSTEDNFLSANGSFPDFFSVTAAPPPLESSPLPSNAAAVTSSSLVAPSVPLEGKDKMLRDHFVHNVLPTVFPVLDLKQNGPLSSADFVLPALDSNPSYLHTCLSASAQHLKATAPAAFTNLDEDIMKHRYATISTLCEALKEDVKHQDILEATLALIMFQCRVGKMDDSLPDIAWHQHFQAVYNLVQKLDYAQRITDPVEPLVPTPLPMSMTAWVDILGATMLRCAPLCAHTYREKHLSPEHTSLGLRELMGCDDKVMIMISEIACLDALKQNGMDDITLCHHVHCLGQQIGFTEAEEAPPSMPYNADGSLNAEQLLVNITAAFRVAARIYLCSLVPGFNPGQDSCIGLVDRLASLLQFIPSGPQGFDRSLVWVYLVAGSVSLPGSSFRHQFEDRLVLLQEQAQMGSFARMTSVLREIWLQMDRYQNMNMDLAPGRDSYANSASTSTTSSASSSPSPRPADLASTKNVPFIHWRDMMQMKGWDFLIL